jgi:hypothetical protein
VRRERSSELRGVGGEGYVQSEQDPLGREIDRETTPMSIREIDDGRK